jgi:hypothetical protein
MFRSSIISFAVIAALLACLGASILDSAAFAQTSTTSTAVDNPSMVAPNRPCNPTEGGCKAFSEAAVESQWQIIATELRRSLNSVPSFGSSDRDALSEREKHLTTRQKCFLRIAVLKQLAQHCNGR